MPSPDLELEAQRVLRLCAVCMYCDGLCPVFPALAGLRGDRPADRAHLANLANLCHNCRACWYDCQYAPPHVFAVNAPAVLARLRRDSYADHVWPRVLRPCFSRPGLGAALMMVAALSTFALIMAATQSSWVSLWTSHSGPGAFYAVAPLGLMAGLAGLSLLWAAVSILVSTLRFWRAISAGLDPVPLAPALRVALVDIITLRHLDGGGPGCHDSGPRFSRRRRVLHHLMAAGVLAAFASTLTAALYQHLLGLAPPFALKSLPVVLGLSGGVAIVAGAGGLLTLEATSDPEPSEPGETRLNIVFLLALEAVTLSGLAVLVWRESAAMGPLLVGHLSLVTGFFVGLPASKAMHAPFRAAALLRSALERRRGRVRADAAASE